MIRHDEEVVQAVCNTHCGGVCPIKLHIKDGVITRIEGHDEFRPCARGRAWRQRVYAPDRITYPLRRVGERGEWKFERISWDEALDTIAAELRRVRKSYGPSAVLFVCSPAETVLLHNAGLVQDLLARTGGYSGVWGHASNEAGQFAGEMTYGKRNMCHTPDDFLNARLIVLWGWNPVVTDHFGSGISPYLARAREAGIRIVCVDPRYTESAAVFADQWIPIRPGTDAAMVIAMAYTMITENLQAQAYLDKYTIGFEPFKEYVLGIQDGIPKTPSWAEDITGVPAAIIANLAREYTTKKPAALIDGCGPGRTAYGEQFKRAVITLAAMTGNIGVSGGSSPAGYTVGFYVMPMDRMGQRVSRRMTRGDNPVDERAPLRRDAFWYTKLPKGHLGGGPSSTQVNKHHIADAILKGRRGGYPADYKMLYMVNTSYVNQFANTNKIVQALKKLEFIVTQEQFMTPTARLADIILPVKTLLERSDISYLSAGMFYGYSQPAIEAVGECKSQFEIATELAMRLGVSDYARKTEEEWLKEVVDGCKDIPDYATFKQEGIYKVELSQPYVAFEEQIRDPVNNPFPTASGKIEIYSRAIAEVGNPRLPPIPQYIETWESHRDPLAEKYPLQLISSHPKRRAHSQFDNMPWLRELCPQAILINTADAQVRGIKGGDTVRVFNDRGQMIIPADVTERIMPGVVDIPEGAWYDPDENGIDRGGCANILTNDGCSPAGVFPSNTALVQVERA